MSQSDIFLNIQKIIANKNKAIPPVKVDSLTEFYSMFLFSVLKNAETTIFKKYLKKQIQAVIELKN